MIRDIIRNILEICQKYQKYDTDMIRNMIMIRHIIRNMKYYLKYIRNNRNMIQ